MRIVLLTFMIISVIANTDAQNISKFYQEIYKADLLYEKGEYNNALLKYEEAFAQVDYVHSRILEKVLNVSKSAKDKRRIKKYKAQIKLQKNASRSTMN